MGKDLWIRYGEKIMLHTNGDYNNSDESNKTVILTLLGLILFMSFIVEEGFTNTFWIILFFFGASVLEKLWKKVRKR